MRSIQYYKVQINPDHYFKTESGLFLDKVGSEESLLPKHGVVVSCPISHDKYKEEDVVYFHHLTLHKRRQEKGGLFVYLREDEIMARKNSDGSWDNGTRLVAKKIPAKKKSEIIITDLEDKKWEEQKFNLNGEIVWAYKDSDYLVDYEEEIAFLRQEYLLYNETKDECLNDFLIVTPIDEGEQWEKQGYIYVQKKVVAQKGKANIAKKNRFGLEGEILYRKTTHTNIKGTPHHCVRFKDILGCYVIN